MEETLGGGGDGGGRRGEERRGEERRGEERRGEERRGEGLFDYLISQLNNLFGGQQKARYKSSSVSSIMICALFIH
jgi:hypothetical protein